MEIEKKVWPEYFEKILNGEKKFELRIADFKINEGDTLILREYNPKTKEYTGRVIKKKAKKIIKVDFSMYPLEQLKRFGMYFIDIE